MLDKAKQWIDKAIKHLQTEFSQLQLGRANPAILDSILIENYGSMQPLNTVASVSTLDAQTITINPWDKTIILAIAKAITAWNLGLNPQTMADSIIISIPPMTEERRIEIAKIVKRLWDEAKVSVRNARSDSHKMISQASEKKEISEDAAKDFWVDLQKMIEDANTTIDNSVKKKSEDVMKV